MSWRIAPAGSGGRDGAAPRTGATADRVVVATALVAGLAIWWPVLAPPERPTLTDATDAWPRNVDLAHLDEKPLFSPSRRPPPPPAEAEPGQLIMEPAARGFDQTHAVAGIARSERDVIAIVENRDTRQIAILRVGSDMDGFAVTAIDPEGVTLRKPGGRPITLRRSGP